MNTCVKCGKEIPKGELFCDECSLNPGVAAVGNSGRLPLAPGKLQAPVVTKPVHKPAPVEKIVVRKAEKRVRRAPWIIAFLVTLLALGGCVYMMFTEYDNYQAAQNRLRTKEADLALRLEEAEELEIEVLELSDQIATLEEQLDKKDKELADLVRELAEAQSSQSQGEYDLGNKEQLVSQLEEEILSLESQMDKLEGQLNKLEGQRDKLESNLALAESTLTAAREYEEKGRFLDQYVVFVENDGTSYYHKYDCDRFQKRSFWAYSPKLAEAEGYTACTVCKPGS